MVSSSSGDLTLGWPSVITAWDKDFPSVARGLKSVEVEGDQIVEKGTFHLTTKYVYSGAEDIEGVTVTSRWSWPRRQSS